MKQNIIKYTLLLFILIAGCTSDQLSKQWATQNLKNQSARILVPNFVDLGYTENHGMVFGINNKADNNISKNILLTIRILLSIGLIIYLTTQRKKTILFHLPFLLILSGAIGNVIDSLRFGHVIDFIHIHIGSVIDWPFLFNIADAYVCIGMGIILLQSFIGEKPKISKSDPLPNDTH